MVLKVKLLELGPPAMILQLAMQPPDINNIKRTILMLKEVWKEIIAREGMFFSKFDFQAEFSENI